MAEPGDRLDSRLRDSAARWRAAQPRPAPLDLASLGAPGRKRSGLRAAAAAAAVAAVLGGVLVAVHLGGDARPSPAPPTAVRPGQVVPWRPLPATHPRIPSVTTPAEPDPAAAAAAPACRARNLRARTFVGGAGGTLYLAVRLHVVGGPPACRLQGYPTVEPHTAEGGESIPVTRMDDDSVYHRPVLASGRPSVLVQLNWGAEWCDPPITNDRIRLGLPAGGGSLTIPGFGRSSIVCDSSAKRGPTPITTRTFEPLHEQAATSSMYDGVRVSGDLDRTARPHSTVRFTVTVTSTRRLSLAPCPDVTVLQGAPHPPPAERVALNCVGVPYRDAHARPYLPAGVPVRFAVEAPAGTRGTRKLSWVLDVPEQVGPTGTLTVR